MFKEAGCPDHQRIDFNLSEYARRLWGANGKSGSLRRRVADAITELLKTRVVVVGIDPYTLEPAEGSSWELNLLEAAGARSRKWHRCSKPPRRNDRDAVASWPRLPRASADEKATWSMVLPKWLADSVRRDQGVILDYEVQRALRGSAKRIWVQLESYAGWRTHRLPRPDSPRRAASSSSRALTDRGAVDTIEPADEEDAIEVQNAGARRSTPMSMRPSGSRTATASDRLRGRLREHPRHRPDLPSRRGASRAAQQAPLRAASRAGRRHVSPGASPRARFARVAQFHARTGGVRSRSRLTKKRRPCRDDASAQTKCLTAPPHLIPRRGNILPVRDPSSRRNAAEPARPRAAHQCDRTTRVRSRSTGCSPALAGSNRERAQRQHAERRTGGRSATAASCRSSRCACARSTRSATRRQDRGRLRAIGFYALLCQLANEQRHTGEHRVVRAPYDMLAARGQMSKRSVKLLLDALERSRGGPLRAAQRSRDRRRHQPASSADPRRPMDRADRRDG